LQERDLVRFDERGVGDGRQEGIGWKLERRAEKIYLNLQREMASEKSWKGKRE
jgi:hypothetical protein